MSRRALIVSSSAELRRGSSALLEEHGWRPVEAGTFVEATVAVAAGFALYVLDFADAGGAAWLAARRASGDTTRALCLANVAHTQSAVGDTLECSKREARGRESKVRKQAKRGVEHPARAERDAPSHNWKLSLPDHANTDVLPRPTQTAAAISAIGRWLDPARTQSAMFDVPECAKREALGHDGNGAADAPPESLDEPPGKLAATSTGRLLVADPVEASRMALEELARDQCVDVVGVSTGQAALDVARETSVDAALIDVDIEGDPGAAFRLARALRALPGRARLPIAFLADDGSIAQRVEAAHAGGSLYLPKPIDPYAFGAAMQQLFASQGSERTRVLLVDDDEDFAAGVAALLAEEGMVVATLADPTRILEVAEEHAPDLLLLDVSLPGVNGFDVARMVRTMPRWRNLPILFLTGRANLRSRIAAFEAGGDDYLPKPIAAEELLARVRVRLARHRLFREMTEKDPLTKLLSRRTLLETLASRLSEARRHSRPLSLALLDVDEFKRVNDTYGHVVGDHVLAGIGHLLSVRFRLEDLRARWGGEEFVLVFPGEDSDTAASVLRRVLAELRNMPFESDVGETFHVTFSAGIACFPEDGVSAESLIRAADARLYRAKALGRGRVIAAPPPSDTKAPSFTLR